MHSVNISPEAGSPTRQTSASHKMKVGILIMTGIGFAWGLLLGLTLQLPAVSSPNLEHEHFRRERAANDLLPLEPFQSHLRNNPDPPSLNNSETYSQGGYKLEERNKYFNELSNKNASPFIGTADQKGKHYSERRESHSGGNEIDTNPEEIQIGLSPDWQALLQTDDYRPIFTDKDSVPSMDSLNLRPDRNTYNNKPERHVNTKDTLATQRNLNLKSMSDERRLGHDIPAQISSQNTDIVDTHQQRVKVATPGETPHQEGNTPPHLDLANVVEGVYWSDQVERLVPAGFSDDDLSQWKVSVREAKVVKMAEGCGRMQNRKVVFQDASEACARYRINTDQMQGEVYSYYLAKLLGISNVPPAVLALPDSQEQAWSSVHHDIISAQWNYEKPVILTPWLHNLKPAYIPPNLRYDSRLFHPTRELFHNRTSDEIVELVQWSELVIFDYLTANLDRMVNNMFNHQWNSQMMDNPTHNLEKYGEKGLLIFLDNESGLFHSYRLLSKYHGYHEKLLKSLCIFRRDTARAIEKLYKTKSVGKELHSLFVNSEPLHTAIPRIPENNVRTLEERLADVYKQISWCRNKFQR